MVPPIGRNQPDILHGPLQLSISDEDDVSETTGYGTLMGGPTTTIELFPTSNSYLDNLPPQSRGSMQPDTRLHTRQGIQTQTRLLRYTDQQIDLGPMELVADL